MQQLKLCSYIMTVSCIAALSGCVSNQEQRLHTAFPEHYRPNTVPEEYGAGNLPAVWPVEPALCRISSVFGETRPAGGGGTRHHGGIDLAAPKGTPVYATADGLVVYANKDGNYGKIVRIEHAGGIQTWYAHLKAIKTREGRTVERGQCIGKVGATGNATGPHLHYEIRIDNKPVNPTKYLPKI